MSTSKTRRVHLHTRAFFTQVFAERFAKDARRGLAKQSRKRAASLAGTRAGHCRHRPRGLSLHVPLTCAYQRSRALRENVEVTLNRGSGVPALSSGSSLEQVLERAQDVLRKSQRADGSWDGACNLGPITTAQAVIVLTHLRRLNGADAADAAKWLRGCQQADGSFVIYPSAPSGDIGATVCAWAALKVTDPKSSVEAIARARAWVDSHGGMDRVIEGLELGDFSALFVGIAGQLDARKLQAPVDCASARAARHAHSRDALPLGRLHARVRAVVRHSLAAERALRSHRLAVWPRRSCDHARVSEPRRQLERLGRAQHARARCPACRRSDAR